jgi:molecular chaperone DnaK (HSP70)
MRHASLGVPPTLQLRLEMRPKARNPISKVLLVGGATRMPAVRRFLTNMTRIEPEEAALDVDEAVALGAAVQVGGRCV